MVRITMRSGTVIKGCLTTPAYPSYLTVKTGTCTAIIPTKLIATLEVLDEK